MLPQNGVHRRGCGGSAEAFFGHTVTSEILFTEVCENSSNSSACDNGLSGGCPSDVFLPQVGGGITGDLHPEGGSGSDSDLEEAHAAAAADATVSALYDLIASGHLVPRRRIFDAAIQRNCSISFADVQRVIDDLLSVGVLLDRGGGVYELVRRRSAGLS